MEKFAVEVLNYNPETKMTSTDVINISNIFEIASANNVVAYTYPNLKDCPTKKGKAPYYFFGKGYNLGDLQDMVDVKSNIEYKYYLEQIISVLSTNKALGFIGIAVSPNGHISYTRPNDIILDVELDKECVFSKLSNKVKSI